MPRARSNDSEDVVMVKKPRAPRARAVSSDSEDAPAPRKRAPRKTAAKKVAPAPEPVVVIESTSTPQRKAPTPIASERRTKARNTRAFIVVVVFCCLLTGAGVVVGMFDHGPIDVVAVVNSRNEQISRGEVRDASGQTVTSAVPVQTDYSGLHPMDPSTIPTTPAPTPAVPTKIPAETAGTSTATSTPVASSTPAS